MIRPTSKMLPLLQDPQKMVNLYSSTHFDNPKDKAAKIHEWQLIKYGSEEAMKPDLAACAFGEASTRDDGTKGMPDICRQRKCLRFRSEAACPQFLRRDPRDV